MFITLKRIIKSGTKTFLRNGFLSASSILVMTIALLSVLSSVFSTVLLESGVEQLESKIDINIYFKPDAPIEKVLELKTLIENLPQVDKEQSNYMSKDDILEEFKKRHQDKVSILESLDFVDSNPFGAILNIKAKKLNQYDNIDNFIASDDIFKKFGDIIEISNFEKNEKAIEKLNIIIDYIKRIGFIISTILITLSLIITFNTMRLIVYTFKEEIAIMRLVGASKFFARGPFVVEGILYGIVSAIFSLFIFWSIIYYISPILESIFLLNLNQFFSGHILEITLGLFLGGIVLGFISTYLAVSKYLKV